MRWPWVSRARLGEVVARERQSVLDLRERCTRAESTAGHLAPEVERLRSVIEAKDETILRMKQEGYVPQAPPSVLLEHSSAKLPREVMDAIEGVAVPGTSLYFDQIRYAAKQMEAEDANAERLAEQIAKGSPVNPHFM